MSVLDRLDNFCYPVSRFLPILQGTSSCNNGSRCHDQVDISLCFEDTVMLYAILIFFWFLAGISFLAGKSKSSYRLPIRFSYLHGAKLILILVIMVTSFCDLFFSIDRGRRGDPVSAFQYLSPSLLVTTMLMVVLMMYRDRKIGRRTSGTLLTFWILLTIYGTFKIRTYILSAEDAGGVDDIFRFSTFIIQYITFILQLIICLFPEPKPLKRIPQETSDRPPCPEEDATFLSNITWWWQTRQIWEGWRRPLVYDNLAGLCHRDKSKVVGNRFINHWESEVKSAGLKFIAHQMEEKEKEEEEEEEEDGEMKVPKLSFEMKTAGSRNKKGPKWKKLSTAAVAHSDESAVALVSKDTPPSHQGGCCHRKEPSLVFALGKTFAKTFAMAFVFKFLQDLLSFASPQLLKLMIRFTQDETEPDWLGYMYAALLFIAAVLQSLFLHQYFHRCFVMGMNIRTAIISAVYRKALRLSSKARQKSTVGEIVNLMSVDAQRFMDLMTFLHMVWSAPLQIVLALIFLYITMGPSIFAGFAIMIIMIPVNGVLAHFMRKLQIKLMGHKDVRIKLINEILNGIKVIKLYAWETPFKDLVKNIRNKELSILKRAGYLTAFIIFSWTCAPFLVSLVTFATYTLANANNPEERLTADKAFVALSLFNILRFPLTMLPMIVTSIIQTSVSVKRLSKFLQNEELDPNFIDWTLEPEDKKDGHSIKLNDASFSWDAEDPDAQYLSNLNLEVKPGQLVAVVGQVGAGKSSLIQALIGEMEKLEGVITLKGSIAYIPQQAWIQNATLEENILFGRNMNKYLYKKTIHGCALESDLEMLPGGDQTEIGEKGINLSGGQKQRVSLARAVYQDADVYLLDDPLSAVDSHVGKHIFDKIIGPEGVLKNKVRLLVTHGVGFLPQCDQIVVMVKGKITEVGSYSELVENNGAFAEFLHTYSNVEKEEENNGVNEEPGSPSRERAESAADDAPLATKRQLSKQISEEKDASGKNRKGSELISEEEAKTGRVHFSILVAYCKACKWPIALFTLLTYLFTNVASVAGNFWLAAWSNAEDRSKVEGANFTKTTACDSGNGTIIGCYLGIYAVFGLSQAAFVCLSAFATAIASYFASKSLHNGMLKNILRSPMSFFDTTPLGRILNRFSKDINIIDESIPRSFRSFLMTVFSVLSTIIVVCVATPIFLAVIFPMSIIYILVQRLYVATSRQLKRLESVTRSPIYSHFQETLLGVASIRAYRQQERFILESEKRVDYNQIAYYPSICANRWLAIRLEFVGNLIIFFASLFAVLQRNFREELGLHISAGLVGLSISYALQVTQSLNWVVRMTSELETNIVAVERTKEYAEIPTEAAAVIESNRPSPDWPSEGRVEFKSYSTCYREGLDLVLKGITLDIPGGTKVGVVGRTGAGKSSLTLALFRIIEATGGSITVDGVNIAEYGLDDLRSKITIIPQDPVLFSGSLRLNLDPFEKHTDEEIWKALECSHLHSFVSGLQQGLQHTIAEGGENLSVGQRQLVCLTRALLRKTKILVLDEATAAVDLETDDLIQKTIRTEFADCTVITIAHRLNTVMDYDKIMVLDGGCIVEFSSPADLLANEESRFYSLAKDAGLV